MSDVKWEMPPAKFHPVGGNKKWAALLEPLKARPGQWAKMGARSLGSTTYLKTRYPDFDFVARKTDAEGLVAPANRAWLYARYLNGEAPE